MQLSAALHRFVVVVVVAAVVVAVRRLDVYDDVFVAVAVAVVKMAGA